MPKGTEASATRADALTHHRWHDRPPILEAIRTLGLNDRKAARLMGIPPEQVASWVAGKRRIPHVRLIALLFIVTRLTGQVGAWEPVNSRYGRRAKVAKENAARWALLAKQELEEDLGGDITAHFDLVLKGEAIGRAALAKLEAEDAS
jgi:hypothetical protein